MYFAFKSQLSDFIVSEILPYELSGEWRFFLYFFWKRKTEYDGGRAVDLWAD